MRLLIRRVVQTLPAPDEALLAEARRARVSSEAHGQFLGRIAALHALEQEPPQRPMPWPTPLRLAAFNAQRLKHRPAVRTLLDEAGAHAALISEADLGMARSGNAHTVRELAAPTGEGYLYGVEFVELDLGNAGEVREHAGEHNACGFHGNAIVTRLALEDPYLIPLEESGFWFPGRKGLQRRIGGRIAVAARVAAAPRPLWLVSTHLESKTDPGDRQAQMQALLRALDVLAPNDACVIGGDFNTKALPRDEAGRDALLDAPERHEPLFADLRSAGFEWTSANAACPTQRPDPGSKPPPGKLDWIVVRGMKAANPRILPALDARGAPVSDHDMLAVDLAF